MSLERGRTTGQHRDLDAVIAATDDLIAQADAKPVEALRRGDVEHAEGRGGEWIVKFARCSAGSTHSQGSMTQPTATTSPALSPTPSSSLG